MSGQTPFPPDKEEPLSVSPEAHAPADASLSDSPAPQEGESSRIAKTGRKILAEAARTLARETPPRKRRSVRFSPLPELPPLARELSESDRAQLVEITDSTDNTLLCMFPEAALRQNLRLRLVAVALRTRLNKIVLHRRRDVRLGSPGAWDAYTGFVHVGEARKDAAIRLLETGAIVGGFQLVHIAYRKQGPQTNSLDLFLADLPPGIYPAHPAQELLEVDSDELHGLVAQAPDLLTTEAVWAANTGRLFKVRKGKT